MNNEITVLENNSIVTEKLKNDGYGEIYTVNYFTDEFKNHLGYFVLYDKNDNQPFMFQPNNGMALSYDDLAIIASHLSIINNQFKSQQK